MGEIAEMMLDGTLCAGCGRALMGHGDGDPRYCKDCRKEETAARHEAHQAAAKRAKCPHCHRKVKLVGLQDHIRDAHGNASAKALARSVTHLVRYEIVNTCGGNCYDTQPSQQGGWVSFEDYEAMRTELVAALNDSRNYVEATTLNASSAKTRENYGDCLRRIDAAIVKATGSAA